MCYPIGQRRIAKGGSHGQTPLCAAKAKYFCAATRRTKDGKIGGARTRDFGVLRRRAAAVGRDGDITGTEVSAIEHVRVTAKPRGAWISLLQPIFAHVFAFESGRAAG